MIERYQIGFPRATVEGHIEVDVTVFPNAAAMEGDVHTVLFRRTRPNLQEVFDMNEYRANEVSAKEAQESVSKWAHEESGVTALFNTYQTNYTTDDILNRVFGVCHGGQFDKWLDETFPQADLSNRANALEAVAEIATQG